MKEKPLSPTMLAALKHAQKHGGQLVRYPGGFWSHEGWSGASSGIWFGTPTVEALTSRGFMAYTDWARRKRGGRFPIEATIATSAASEETNGR